MPSPSAATEEGEFTAFDFIVGGNSYGYLYGRFGTDWFEIENIEDALSQLPPVKNKQSFAPLFAGRIVKTRAVPDVGVVSLDINKFAISLEIAAAEVLIKKIEEIEDPGKGESGISVRNAVFAAGSTPTEKLDLSPGITVGHNTVISRGNVSLQGAGDYTGEASYLLREALGRYDFKALEQDLTASGGLMETSSLQMRAAKTVSYYGMRLESNRDVLFRDELLQGSYIEVFLPRHGQVEVFRGEGGQRRAIFSRMLDFGTTQLDTRNFPSGSYDIEIVIKDDAGAIISSEKRPFTKTQQLTPQGKSSFVIEGGEMRDNLDSTGVTVAQATFRRRLTDMMDWGLGAALTSDDQVLEGSLRRQETFPVFGEKGQLETSLTGGLSGRGEPVGVWASAQWRGEKINSTVTASQVYDRPEVADKEGSLALSGRKALNFGFFLPLEFPYLNTIVTNLSAEFSQAESSGSQYRYGPRFDYRFDPRWGYQPMMTLEYAVSDETRQILAGFSLRSDVRDTVWTKTLNVSGRMEKDNNETSANASLAFSGKNFGREDWRRNLAASATFMASPLTSDRGSYAPLAYATADYASQALNTKVYLNQKLKKEHAGTFGGELSSTQLWFPGGGIKASGERVSPETALAMIRLKGTGSGNVGIALDGGLKAVIKIGENAVIPIPTFKKSKIGIFNRSGLAELEIAEEDYEVVGYPGNIIYREFNIHKLYVLMGTLLNETGTPLPNLRFAYRGRSYYTDDDGFFTLETPVEPGQKIEIAEGGLSCTSVIPAQLPEDSVTIELGSIACVKKQ